MLIAVKTTKLLYSCLLIKCKHADLQTVLSGEQNYARMVSHIIIDIILIQTCWSGKSEGPSLASLRRNSSAARPP